MLPKEFYGISKSVSTQTKRRMVEDPSNGAPETKKIYGTVKIHSGAQVFEIGYGSAEKNGKGYKVNITEENREYLERGFNPSRFTNLSHEELRDLGNRCVNLSMIRTPSEDERILLKITQSVLDNHHIEEVDDAFNSLIKEDAE